MYKINEKVKTNYISEGNIKIRKHASNVIYSFSSNGSLLMLNKEGVISMKDSSYVSILLIHRASYIYVGIIKNGTESEPNTKLCL